MIKSTHVLAIAALVCSLFAPQPVRAQINKKPVEPTTGKVVGVEKAKTGKSYTLKMKAADDTEYTVPLVPRTLVVVSAVTDMDIVKPGFFVQGKVIGADAGHHVLLNDLTICIGLPVQPQWQLAEEDGQDSTYQILGKILAYKKDGIQKGTELITVNCGSKTINLEYEREIVFNLKLSDPSFIKEGDSVEVEGPVNKTRKQITAKSVTVTSAEPIKAEEYFAALQEAKDAKKTKTSKAVPSKSKDGSDTKSDGDSEPAKGGKDADPFGVLNEKKSTKPKADKGEKPADSDTPKGAAKEKEPKAE